MKKFRFLNRKIQHKIILDRKFFLTILFCLLLSFSLCVCVFPVITITNYFCNLEKNNKWNDNEASSNCEENKGNNMHFKISNKISIIHLFNSSIDKNSKLKKTILNLRQIIIWANNNHHGDYYEDHITNIKKSDNEIQKKSRTKPKFVDKRKTRLDRIFHRRICTTTITDFSLTITLKYEYIANELCINFISLHVIMIGSQRVSSMNAVAGIRTSTKFPTELFDFCFHWYHDQIRSLYKKRRFRNLFLFVFLNTYTRCA